MKWLDTWKARLAHWQEGQAQTGRLQHEAAYLQTQLVTLQGELEKAQDLNYQAATTLMRMKTSMHSLSERNDELEQQALQLGDLLETYRLTLQAVKAQYGPIKPVLGRQNMDAATLAQLLKELSGGELAAQNGEIPTDTQTPIPASPTRARRKKENTHESA